jgi:hypothetical protein
MPTNTTTASTSHTDWDKVVVIPMVVPSFTLSVQNTPFVDDADHLNYLQETHAQVKAVVDALRIPGVRAECYCGDVKQSDDVSQLRMTMFSLLIHLANDIRQHPLFKIERN